MDTLQSFLDTVKIVTTQRILFDFNNIKTIKSDYANWVIPGKLMCGPSPVSLKNECDVSTNLKNLLADGIDTFVCLQMESNPDEYKKYIDVSLASQITFLHEPIVDNMVPSHQIFLQSIAQILQLLINGRKVYIHCYGGHGRTGLYVIALLGCLFPELRRKELAQYYFQSVHDMRRKQMFHFYGILPSRVAENECQQRLLDDFFAILRFL